MTTTSFLKLQKPPFDTIPWDDAVNGNMDILDAYISRYMSTPNFVGAWTNSTLYTLGQTALDTSDGFFYNCLVTHTSAVSPTTFSADRVANPSYWVQLAIGSPTAGYAPLASPIFTGNPTAPTPTGGDNDTSLATTAFVAPAFNNIGRNLIHNPVFRVFQRGAGPFTANYTADRWLIQGATDTVSYSVGTLSDAGRTAIGDESAANFLVNAFTGSAAAGAYNHIAQRMENVRRLAGKTITVSFWAIANSGTPKLGINILQNFGTGGSPSAGVRALATGNSVTLSTTWTRYTTTIVVPSIVGKTLGSNNDDFTTLELWMSSGATNNAIAGNIGVQSSTISIWGVQLEIGSIATQLEKRDNQVELALCQRFYYSAPFSLSLYSAAGQAVWQTFTLPVNMRATPTVNSAGGATANASAVTFSALSSSTIQISITATALGVCSWTGATMIAVADL
jgi:hypothetical protein